jgi:hypothetical protein
VIGKASIACAGALIRGALMKAVVVFDVKLRARVRKPKLITPDQIAKAVRRHEAKRLKAVAAGDPTADELPVTEQVVAVMLGYMPIWRHDTGLVSWIGPHPDPEKFADRASPGCPNPALLQIGARDRIAIDPQADFRLWCAMALGALVVQSDTG